MRRLLRIVFNTLTVLSLVLAVGVAVLWVRSYVSFDWIYFQRNALARVAPADALVFDAGSRREAGVAKINSGTLFLALPRTDPAGYQFTSSWRWMHATDAKADSVAPPLPFVPWFRIESDEDHHKAIIPLWPFAAFTLVLPSLRMLLHHRRPAVDGCPACNYDLRATPDRCPECGAVAKVASV